MTKKKSAPVGEIVDKDPLGLGLPDPAIKITGQSGVTAEEIELVPPDPVTTGVDMAQPGTDMTVAARVKDGEVTPLKVNQETGEIIEGEAVEAPAPKPFLVPGFVDGLDNEVYHGDCCPEPSLSASGMRELVESCPMKFWHNSYLNPDFEREESKEFDIGSAAHTFFLEPDMFSSRIVEIEAPDYRTKAAQEAKAAAYEAEKIPLLSKQLKMVIAMGNALYSDPFVQKAFKGGVKERSHAWIDGATKAWVKCRPDYQNYDLKRPLACDYKTVESAAPADLRNQAYRHTWFVKEVVYKTGIKATTGVEIMDYRFIAQEKEPPYLVTVYEIVEEDVNLGIQYAQRATEIFKRCLDSGIWPGYTDPRYPTSRRVLDLAIPGWSRYQLEELLNPTDAPVYHGKSLSDEDRKFLAAWYPTIHGEEAKGKTACYVK